MCFPDDIVLLVEKHGIETAKEFVDIFIAEIDEWIESFKSSDQKEAVWEALKENSLLPLAVNKGNIESLELLRSCVLEHFETKNFESSL